MDTGPAGVAKEVTGRVSSKRVACLAGCRVSLLDWEPMAVVAELELSHTESFDRKTVSSLNVGEPWRMRTCL